MNSDFEQFRKDKEEVEKIISENMFELNKKYPMMSLEIVKGKVITFITGERKIDYKISAEISD